MATATRAKSRMNGEVTVSGRQPTPREAKNLDNASSLPSGSAVTGLEICGSSLVLGILSSGDRTMSAGAWGTCSSCAGSSGDGVFCTGRYMKREIRRLRLLIACANPHGGRGGSCIRYVVEKVVENTVEKVVGRDAGTVPPRVFWDGDEASPRALPPHFTSPVPTWPATIQRGW